MAYVDGLPRVSHIVSSVYPFEGEAKKRFAAWLKSKGIKLDHYMNIANSYGTAIHLWLERYIIGQNIEQECSVENNEKDINMSTYEPHLTKYVSYGKQFLKEERVTPIHTEHYICVDKRYQGTIDLIGEIDWEKWVLDYKTFWVAQEILWTKWPTWRYKKPYDKLKKATLQLSLYALPLWIKNIWVVELAEHWYEFHKLKIMTQEEIDIIIKNYYIWQQKNVANAEAKT